MLEPPYGEISDLLRSGMVVPFLGAGVNLGNRPPGASWTGPAAPFLPSGAELARLLAEKINFPADDEHDLVDLPKVASYFAETSAPRRLRERLNEVFDRDVDPCSIHTYLASLDTPLLIVTTNYDNLTERAFAKANRPYDLVVHSMDRKEWAASVFWWRHGAAAPEPVEPKLLSIDLAKTTVIYKMHGSVDRLLHKWDSYVVTEEDYVDFLAQMTMDKAVPAQFMSHFRTRHFLFLGYGLRDWNVRVVLKNLRRRAEDEDEELKSWAIQVHSSPLETVLWQARDVTIYDVDINAFALRLMAAAS